MTRMFLGIPMWAEEERDELGAGKALMRALQRDLRQAGFTIREDIESWDDYGWSLVAEHRGTSIWCTVQPADDWLIQCWPATGLFHRLTRRDGDAPCREVMDAILAALSRQRLLDGAQWVRAEALKVG
jgi:hypothetical protein